LDTLNKLPTNVTDLDEFGIGFVKNFNNIFNGTTEDPTIFLENFKNLIENSDDEKVNSIFENIINELVIQNGNNWPLNINNNKFSTIHSSKILGQRLTQIIKQKYQF
jgi:hypothetical protein